MLALDCQHRQKSARRPHRGRVKLLHHLSRGRMQSGAPLWSKQDQDKYLGLHGEHETARLQALKAEIELRTDKVICN